MATHHQKLHPLDMPATRRDVLKMMQQMARATDARLTAAGIPPLGARRRLTAEEKEAMWGDLPTEGNTDSEGAE